LNKVFEKPYIEKERDILAKSAKKISMIREVPLIYTEKDDRKFIQVELIPSQLANCSTTSFKATALLDNGFTECVLISQEIADHFGQTFDDFDDSTVTLGNGKPEYIMESVLPW